MPTSMTMYLVEERAHRPDVPDHVEIVLMSAVMCFRICTALLLAFLLMHMIELRLMGRTEACPVEGGVSRYR